MHVSHRLTDENCREGEEEMVVYGGKHHDYLGDIWRYTIGYPSLSLHVSLTLVFTL